MADDDPGPRPLADRDVRLLARVLDRSLLAVALVPMVGLHAALPIDQNEFVGGVANLTGLAFALALFLTQLVLLTVRGQSVAKWVLGIRLERPDGSLPGFLRAVVLRECVFALLALTGILALVDVAFIFERNRQTLHDRLADTRVVRVGGGAS